MKHINKEGGVAYSLSLKEEIDELFSIGLLRGTFYKTMEEVEQNAHGILKEALEKHPEYATEKAIEGAVKHGLKTVPLLWLIYLSTLEDKSLFKKAFPQIIRNPILLHAFLEQSRKNGVREGVGRVIKNTANQWLMENLSEYWACRYRNKLKEITRITRPKSAIGSEDFQKYMDYIQNGTLSFDRIQELKQVLSDIEADKVTDRTLMKIQKYHFQIEELKHQFGKMGEENLGKVYRAVFKNLSYPALIMNLASTEVFINNEEEILGRVGDTELYRKSGMLPFSLISAHYMVQSDSIRKALRKVLRDISKDTELTGNLMIVVDTSSSMSYMNLTKSLSAMDVAALYAALLKHQMPDSRLFAVASKKKELRKGKDIFITAGKITGEILGMGTMLGQMMEEKPEGDILVFTDSEMGEDLEEVWLREGKGRLIIWQMVNSNVRVSKHPSVIYLQGYNEESWKKLYAIIKGGTR